MSARRENGIRRMLFGLQRFFCFFLMVGMIVTCCTIPHTPINALPSVMAASTQSEGKPTPLPMTRG